MTKILRYKVIPECKLIVEYFEGQIGLNELIDFQLRQMEDKSCNPGYNDLTDLRNSEFIVQKNDVKKYADFVKQTEIKQGNRKVAIITENPGQTAITMLYSSYTKQLPLNNKVFSTLEAALKWIGIPGNDFLKVENILDKLKNG
jgi:hypothetical protein